MINTELSVSLASRAEPVPAIFNGPRGVALPRRSFVQVVSLVLYMRGDFTRIDCMKFHTPNYGAGEYRVDANTSMLAPDQGDSSGPSESIAESGSCARFPNGLTNLCAEIQKCFDCRRWQAAGWPNRVERKCFAGPFWK